MEDLGTIPTLEDWMKGSPIQPWMMGKKEPKKTTHIPFESPKQVSPGVEYWVTDGSKIVPQVQEVKPYTYTGPDRSNIKFID